MFYIDTLKKSPKTEWLKITNISYLIVSVGLEFRSHVGWGEGGSGSFPVIVAVRCQPGLQSAEDLTGTGRSAPDMTHSHGCWPEASASLFGPLHVGLLERSS